MNLLLIWLVKRTGIARIEIYLIRQTHLLLHPFRTAILDNRQALPARPLISVAWSTLAGCTTSLAISRFHLLALSNSFIAL